jgi:NAD(P)-dependent dehydrogenase (short-subunit alcohol dehydrogenase family)
MDGAFNNGGVRQQQPGPLDTTTDEDIDEQFEVNFRSHWAAMVAEAALMRRSGGGAIVTPRASAAAVRFRRFPPMAP